MIRFTALFPKIEIHMTMYENGIISVPRTNCPIVRPFEMRARNMPTKADHAIHHAQKNSVHDCIQPAG